MCICICWLKRSTEVLNVNCIYTAHLAASPELSLLYLSLVSSGLAADTPEQLVAVAIWNQYIKLLAPRSGAITVHSPGTQHSRAQTYSASRHHCNINEDNSNAKEGQIFRPGTTACFTANALQPRAWNRNLCDKTITTWKPASKKPSKLHCLASRFPTLMKSK